MINAQEKMLPKQGCRSVCFPLRDRRCELDGNGDLKFSKPFNFFAFFVLITLLTMIHSPIAMRLPYLPEVGEIASRDIKTDRDLLIEDRDNTKQRRQEASAAIPPVYTWNNGMIDLITYPLEQALEWLEMSQKNTGADQKNTFTRREAFSQRLEEEVQDSAYQALLAMPQLKPLITALYAWLNPFKEQLVVDGSAVLAVLAKRPFYVIRSAADGSEKQVSGTAALIDLNTMRQQLSESSAQWLSPFPPAVRQWLLEEARTQIRPNLVLDIAETQARRKLAHDAVAPIFFHAKAGQMVVREGAVVTEAIHKKLHALHKTQWSDELLWRLLGLASTVGSLLWVGRWFLLKTSPVFPRTQKASYLLGLILLITSLLSTLTFVTGQGLMEWLNWPSHMVMYLPQAALGAALASLMIGSRVGIPGGALVLGLIISFLCALVTDGGLPLFAYYVIGSLVAAATLRACRRRFDVLYCGIKVGVAQMCIMPVVELLTGNHTPSWEWLLGAAMALISGGMVGLWGLALIPMMESLFNITTDSRLAELASGDHPLVRELSLRTPGTYHHAVMMGNLAEAAAENIQANPLLARVMALYHDIGKMQSPQYFVENQSGENRHDHLTPSMSSKVIMAHVKGGQELAKKYQLGEHVQEAIVSHHGTSLLQFFYNRAVNQAAKRYETVAEADFRYPGPKPHSREAGILMLADSVEAAARTLKTPAPAQIHALVKRIVAAKISDGQLDECALTLREIGLIEEAFTRVLTLGFYHKRIEYPDQVGTSQKKSRAHGKHFYPLRPYALAKR